MNDKPWLSEDDVVFFDTDFTGRFAGRVTKIEKDDKGRVRVEVEEVDPGDMAGSDFAADVTFSSRKVIP